MFGKKSVTYLEWRKLEHYYASLPVETEIVNIGSSISKADFEYSLWDKEGICLAGEPQTLFYDEQMLRQFSKNIKRGAHVYICLCFFSLLVEFYEKDRANYKYYFILDKGRIQGYCRRKEFILRNFPCLLAPSLAKEEIKGWLKVCLKWIGRKSRLKRGSDFLSIEQSDKKAAKGWVQGWYDEFGWYGIPELTDGQKKTVDRVFEILVRLIDYCSENRFKPVLVVPPVSKNIKELLPDSLLNECFWQYITRLAGRGYEIVDFYHSDLFPDETYFEDALKLSTKGKQIFNEYLKKRAADIVQI